MLKHTGEIIKMTNECLSNEPKLTFKRLIYEKHDYLAKITINRPDALNCFDYLTLKELAKAYEDVTYDDDIAVLVITGAGDRAFCTGADLKEQTEFTFKRPDNYYKWMYAFIEMHDRLRNIGKPTIARLNGMVVGGGNELNMACDLAIAASHVTIRQVGAARGSVASGGATQWLPLIVGDRRAREILFTCEPISAQKALDWGLVNQVVPKEELDEAVNILAQKLYQKLPGCLRYTKQQLNFWRDFSWGMTIGHARDWLTVHSNAYETKYGLKTFMDKSEIDYAKVRQHHSSEETTWQNSLDNLNCPQCQSMIPDCFKFCGNCGVTLK